MTENCLFTTASRPENHAFVMNIDYIIKNDRKNAVRNGWEIVIICDISC